MRKQQKIINLYNDYSISTIKHVISIQSEEDLNQFWDFIETQAKSKYILMNNFISMFYEFANSYILQDDIKFFEIILEESSENFYLTFWNKKIATKFKSYLEKTSTDFLLEQNRISIKLSKASQDKFLVNDQVKESKRHEKLCSPQSAFDKYPRYTFITADDSEDLHKLCEDMQDTMYISQKHGFNNDRFISLRSSLSLFCLTLRYYDSISNIANHITEFSNTININKEAILNLSIDELGLISGLINNIELWFKILFIEGGADLYFMDNSIKADIQMISQLFAPLCELSESDDLDDIFNF